MFRPLKATLSGRDTTVLLKLIVDGTTDHVVGCHIVGEGAAEMVQIAAIAVKMGAKKADFDATIALHPTAAESLWVSGGAHIAITGGPTISIGVNSTVAVHVAVGASVWPIHVFAVTT